MLVFFIKDSCHSTPEKLHSYTSLCLVSSLVILYMALYGEENVEKKCYGNYSYTSYTKALMSKIYKFKGKKAGEQQLFLSFPSHPH